MGNVGMANLKSEVYHFFFVSPVSCWTLTDSILYMEEIVVYLIVP